LGGQEHEQIGLETTIFHDGGKRIEDVMNGHDEGSEVIVVERTGDYFGCRVVRSW